MRETILKTRRSPPIHGVLCQAAAAGADSPTVIFLNSGLMHKVGTCRLSVKLARMLASKGISSVRFDFPGVGDSLARTGRDSHLKNAPDEIAEVIERVRQTTGAKKFIIFGLCSGADAAFATALNNDEVVGIVQIDPYLFRTWKWYLYHYPPRLFRPSVWLKKIAALFSARKSPGQRHDPDLVEFSEDAREMMARGDVLDGYRQLADKNLKLLVIVTGGQAWTYNYYRQFYDIYSGIDWRNTLTLTYLPDAEHILPEPHSQAHVEALIADWVSEVAGQNQ